MALQAAVLICLLGAMAWVDLRARRVHGADRKPDALSDGLMVAATGVAVGGGLLLASMSTGGFRLPSALAAGLGALVGIAGLWLRQVAIVQLAGSYTLQLEIQPNQSLVTSGVYAWVRHPGYTGLLFQFLAVQIALGCWPSVLALVPMLCLLPMRIGEEERLLVERFGPEYTAYAERVPALVPSLRRSQASAAEA